MIIAAGILNAGLMNSATAAPLVPATAFVTPTDLAVATQVRWRGHGGGGAGLAAGLATGLIIGGLLAAPLIVLGTYQYSPRDDLSVLRKDKAPLFEPISTD